ncbi:MULTISPECIES: hypothetical protein [unclassified Streptomyces]|uniref:hypothetical protein n=1 Tax=unclassified Streptomyces TaxID=2593676 RepID=UPI002E21BEE8|nr:hypothetical protein OG217_37585 [Streptomyces sp. NBC_01023]
MPPRDAEMHLRHDSNTDLVGIAGRLNHMVGLGWLRSPQAIEVQFSTIRAGAADVALYTTVHCPSHIEADWKQTAYGPERSGLTAGFAAPGGDSVGVVLVGDR